MKSDPQFGEEGQLWRHFSRRCDGFFVEVGANHPTQLSRTRPFEQQGWHGLLVEPLAAKSELLRHKRFGRRVFQLAGGTLFVLTGTVERPRLLNEIRLDTPVRCRWFALKRRFR
jgi:hypothetical protein